MKRTLILLGGLVIAVGATVYMTGMLGCSLPKTHIAQRKLYEGPATRTAAVEDWPAWRGPRGDLISRETLPDRLPEGGPRQLWAADVGLGYSSPIAAAGRVYLFSMNGGKETLTAFDANSGTIVWSDEGGEGWTSSYVGTRATPSIDGDRIYTYGGQGVLICRNLADGKPRWTLNVLAETGSKPQQWGAASSPLVAGNLVYVQSGQGGAVAVAVDKLSGKVAWKSQATGAGGYAHPILADVAGAKQLIIFGGTTTYGMDPQSGRTLWEYPWQTSFEVNSSTPIYRDGKLFVTSEYDHGCIQLALSPSGATRVWENKNILGKFQGAILDGDYLYANSAGTIVCVAWADGTLKWRASDPKMRLGIGGAIVRSGDKLLAMTERGKLILARATPDGIQSLGQAEEVVEGKEVWATPLLYGGRVYVKGAQELVCLEIGAGK
jgi:outer membrane protein assembly factor BamB